MKVLWATMLPLVLCLHGPAAADPAKKCNDSLLKGQYALTASGFTRPPPSGPGTPWTPKAVLQVLQFNGDGTLSAPVLTLANPFGDSGAILQPPAGADGSYTVNEDCTGTMQFFDAAGVSYRIFVSPPRGEKVWMIQTNPSNNVMQGSAVRLR